MSLDELKAAVQARFGGRVWVREAVAPGKALAVCGVNVPGGPKKKAYEKSISFNAAAIPDDALAKIERAIE